jgi:plastocyanin
MPRACDLAIRVMLTVTAIGVLSACSAGAPPPAPAQSSAVAPASAPPATIPPSPMATPPPSSTPAPPMPTAIAGAPASDVVLKLTAIGDAAWDVKELDGPAGTTFKIEMTNKVDHPHNLVIQSGIDVASRLAALEKFSGPATKTLDVPGLPAGTYQFRCTLHDSMRGELIIK